MNVSEIKTERLRILSLGREQANFEETVCFTLSELDKRKGDGDKQDVVKYYRGLQGIYKVQDGWVHEVIELARGFIEVGQRFHCTELPTITAAEYELAKSPAPVAGAGDAKEKPEQVVKSCENCDSYDFDAGPCPSDCMPGYKYWGPKPAPVACLDCGQVHEGSCVNTNEAKEKPEQVGYRLLAGNEAIQHGDEFRCDCHIGCKDWQTTSLTKGSTVDVARAQFCKNFIYRRATPPANILPASEIKVLDEVCKIGQPTKPEPVVIGGHKWCSQCHQHHKNGTACPKAKQAEPWNTSVSHFLQLEQIRRRHDALEARHNEQDKIISSLCKKITELEAQ